MAGENVMAGENWTGLDVAGLAVATVGFGLAGGVWGVALGGGLLALRTVVPAQFVFALGHVGMVALFDSGTALPGFALAELGLVVALGTTFGPYPRRERLVAGLGFATSAMALAALVVRFGPSVLVGVVVLGVVVGFGGLSYERISLEAPEEATREQ